MTLEGDGVGSRLTMAARVYEEQSGHERRAYSAHGYELTAKRLLDVVGDRPEQSYREPHKGLILYEWWLSRGSCRLPGNTYLRA